MSFRFSSHMEISGNFAWKSSVLFFCTCFTLGFFFRSSVFYCVSVCFKIREFFIYFIKIQAGVLYIQMEIRNALKVILLKGKIMLIRLKDSFLLHLNWGCTNTRSGIKHRLGRHYSLYYVQNLLISRWSLQRGGFHRNAPRLIHMLFYNTNVKILAAEILVMVPLVLQLLVRPVSILSLYFYFPGFSILD